MRVARTPFFKSHGIRSDAVAARKTLCAKRNGLPDRNPFILYMGHVFSRFSKIELEEGEDFIYSHSFDGTHSPPMAYFFGFFHHSAFRSLIKAENGSVLPDKSCKNVREHLQHHLEHLVVDTHLERETLWPHFYERYIDPLDWLVRVKLAVDYPEVNKPRIAGFYCGVIFVGIDFDPRKANKYGEHLESELNEKISLFMAEDGLPDVWRG